MLSILFAEDHENDHQRFDHDAIDFLRKWIAEAILPKDAFADPSPYSIGLSLSLLWLPQTYEFNTEDEKATLTPDEVAVFRAMSLSGLLLLARLQVIKPLWEYQNVPAILTCLASFTDLNDIWTCSEVRGHAYSLLADYAAFDNISNLLTAVLEERIKPTFAKTSNLAFLHQARKATDPSPNAAALHDINCQVKLWKYHEVYIVTVFQWVLKRLDVRGIIAHSQARNSINKLARRCQ